MPEGTLFDALHQQSPSSARWRERLPTVVGLTIVIGLVIHNLVDALLAPPDQLASVRVHLYRLGGGGYWVDPQSLGQMARNMSLWTGITWILAIALVLVVSFWEKRPLTSIGLRTPRAGDLLPAFGALVAFHLIGFAGNLLGSSTDPKAVAAVFALPLVVRLWILTEGIMFRGYFIERVEELTGSTWIAAILSCVLFGLAHASGWGFAIMMMTHGLTQQLKRDLYFRFLFNPEDADITPCFPFTDVTVNMRLVQLASNLNRSDPYSPYGDTCAQ